MMSPYVALPENMNRCWHTAAFTSAAAAAVLKLHSFWPYPDWFSLKSKQRLRIDFLWNQASFSSPLFYWLYRHSAGETFILEVKTQLLLRSFPLTKSIARAEARATEQNRRQRRTSLRGVRKNCRSTGVEIWWELVGFKGISLVV